MSYFVFNYIGIFYFLACPSTTAVKTLLLLLLYFCADSALINLKLLFAATYRAALATSPTHVLNAMCLQNNQKMKCNNDNPFYHSALLLEAVPHLQPERWRKGF